jgi:hypothetical protein
MELGTRAEKFTITGGLAVVVKARPDRHHFVTGHEGR